MKTSRRTKGEGSITQLPNGKWRVRIEGTPIAGKRRWLSKTCINKTEAIKALKVLERKLEDSLKAVAYQGDFSNFCDEYIELCITKKIRSTTITRYRNALVYWKEAFKHKKLTNINAVDVEKVYREQRGIRKDTTLFTDLTILSQVFKYAIKCKHIQFNPVHGVSKPKGGTQKKSSEPLYATTTDHEDIIRYLKGCYNDFKYKGEYKLKNIMYPIYMTAYCTGLRLGEITGLKWSDIDLDTGLIVIHQQFVNGEYVPLKTEKSNRYLYMGEDILELLRSFKEACKLHNVDSEFLWKSSRNNRPFSASYLSVTFRRVILEYCKHKHLTFHSIRHTYATLLMNAKIPMQGISELLGHSSILITEKIYSHVDEATVIEAANVIGNAAFAGHNQVTIGSQKGYLKGHLKVNNTQTKNSESRMDTEVS